MAGRYGILSGGVGAGGAANQMASSRRGSGNTPAVNYLILLIVGEYAAYLALRYVFRSVHGG